MQRGLYFQGLLVLSLLFVGCGGSGEVEVSGKLTKGGSPLQVSDNGDVQISFVQVKDGTMTGYTFMANPDDNGQYSVTLPSGDYKVTVSQLDPYPDTDKLEGKFDQENTPITKSIDGGETWDVELDEYAGK